MYVGKRLSSSPVVTAQLARTGVSEVRWSRIHPQGKACIPKSEAEWRRFSQKIMLSYWLDALARNC